MPPLKWPQIFFQVLNLLDMKNLAEAQIYVTVGLKVVGRGVHELEDEGKGDGWGRMKIKPALV